MQFHKAADARMAMVAFGCVASFATALRTALALAFAGFGVGLYVFGGSKIDATMDVSVRVEWSGEMEEGLP